MTQESMDVVLYCADADRRRSIIEGVGLRPGKGAPTIKWIETATPAGAIGAMKESEAPIVVLDADVPKVGGMAVLQDIKNELEQDPVAILLIARPQDDWLADWSGAAITVLAPYDPLDLQVAMVEAMRQAR